MTFSPAAFRARRTATRNASPERPVYRVEHSTHDGLFWLVRYTACQDGAHDEGTAAECGAFNTRREANAARDALEALALGRLARTNPRAAAAELGFGDWVVAG